VINSVAKLIVFLETT